MRKTLIAVGAMSVLLSAQAANAKEMLGWTVKGNGLFVNSGQTYSLYNTDQEGYLKYQDRTGANLGWVDRPNQAVKFQRQSGTGAIKCGEKFAMFVDKEWFYYGSQTFGINLTSSKTLKPEHYQWEFSQCIKGLPIALHLPVTLRNTKENDSLVGCKRIFGVNLCWADDVVTVLFKNYHKNAIPTP
jgi:hypothetical protein